MDKTGTKSKLNGLLISPELDKRLLRICDIRQKPKYVMIEEAIRQLVVNQERFILSLRRKEYRDLKRGIYRYCPFCLSKISTAFTRRKEKINGKKRTMRIKIGYYCLPCEAYLKENDALTIVEKRSLNNGK